MATVHETITISVAPAAVWDAVRDVGALHTRLVPGFVVDTVMLADAEHPTRRVTFANGVVLDEVIVAVDDERRRLVWSIRGASVDHHNGAVLVEAAGGETLVSWTADVLPDALADQYRPLMVAGLAVMKTQLERDAQPSG